MLGDPAHPLQLLAWGHHCLGPAALASDWECRACRACAHPELALACERLRVPHAAPVPACASPSTPPHKQRELADEAPRARAASTLSPLSMKNKRKKNNEEN